MGRIEDWKRLAWDLRREADRIERIARHMEFERDEEAECILVDSEAGYLARKLAPFVDQVFNKMEDLDATRERRRRQEKLLGKHPYLKGTPLCP